MGVAIVVAPIFILMLLLVAVIPVVMGIYVYRDAKKRGMNAVLWTLVSALAPGFIGLIIYLIVRGEHPDLQCAACGKPVSSTFAVCPYCGATLREKCSACGYILESGWTRCAGCGAEIPEEQRSRTTTVGSGSGLKKLLVLIIIVPLVLMVLLFGATCLFAARSESFYASGFSFGADELEITLESIDGQSSDLTDWITGCDEQGKGVYVLRNDYRNGSEAVSNILVYRNDGYYDVAMNQEAGGWFSPDVISLNFYPAFEDVSRTYTLSFFSCGSVSGEYPVLKAADGISGAPVEFKLEETDKMDGLPINFLGNNTIGVSIDEQLTGVYHVSVNYYADGEIIESEQAQLADESDAAGESFDFMVPAMSDDKEYTITIELQDENFTTIYTTDPVALDAGGSEGWYLSADFFSENGTVTWNYEVA